MSASERAAVLDALRGFALLGIFLSHIPDFSGHSFLSPADRAGLDAFGVDRLLAGAQDFLIRGKFFSLFSLLFGIGFAIQLESAVRRGADFQRHFTRRLTFLLLIGLAHAGLWYGDILKDYALLGFALIVVHEWRTVSIARATAIVLALRVVWPVVVYGVWSAMGRAVASADPAGGFSDAASAFAGTDPGAVFRSNLDLVRLKALQMVYEGRAISVLSMFLLGALVGRLGVHRDLVRHREVMKRVLIASAPIGIVGNAILTPLHLATPDFPPSRGWVAEQMLFAIAVPALALTYATAFALVWMHSRPLLAWLAPAGRMALTIYLSQTLIGVLLFYGVGFGLGGHVGIAEGSAIAIAVFLAQCLVASLWLRAFHFGPIEWLWRLATYGPPVPFRKRSLRAASPERASC